jgi:hypothetical protein
MANRIRMAALNTAMTKPRPVSTTTRSITHTADGDQYRLVRYPSGLGFWMKPAMPPRPTPNTSATTTSR